MNLIEDIVANAPALSDIRRDIHAHPELSFKETRTADLVADLLTQWGIPVHRGLGKTGVVGILKNGDSPRTVGLRADMDALPMTEANEFAHASRHPGVMHACGHDGHTTMLLGAAQYLAHSRDFDGTAVFIFQPAEEGLGGARRMIAEGASIEEMTDAARKNQGMRSLRESAVQLVRDGVTTPEELLKITYFEE